MLPKYNLHQSLIQMYQNAHLLCNDNQQPFENSCEDILLYRLSAVPHKRRIHFCPRKSFLCRHNDGHPHIYETFLLEPVARTEKQQKVINTVRLNWPKYF